MFDAQEYDQLDREDVTRLIDEIAQNAETRYIVVRNRNDEELSSFDIERDAETFIDDNDYNRERVTIRQDADADSVSDLTTLRAFDEECLNDIPDWAYGSVVYRGINGDRARDFYDQLIPAGVDLNASPYQFINWDEVADELQTSAESDGNYASISGTYGRTYFYYL